MKKRLFLLGLSISLILQSISVPVYALEAENVEQQTMILEEETPAAGMIEENYEDEAIIEEDVKEGTPAAGIVDEDSENVENTEESEHMKDVANAGNADNTDEEIELVEVIMDDSHIIQAGSFNPVTDNGIAAISMESFSLNSSQEKKILSAMSNRSEKIDVSSYKIPTDKIWEIFIDLVNSHPELYFVRSGCSYYYNPSTNYVTTLCPVYYDGLGYSKDKSAFQAAAKKAIAQTSGIKNDFEKALVLHDYLVLHGEYDTSALNSSNYDVTCHSAYGALVNQIAVCQGYALAYKYLLNQVGIDCYIVTSESMNHAWNMVKLNGSYYHVDVTWDDPISDQFGYAQHNYFLLSDNTISDHSGWVVSEGGKALNISAASTTYEGYAWKRIKSGIFSYNGNWYYINSSTKSIVKNSNLANASTESTFYSLSSYWNSTPSLALYKDIFYFPSADGIYQLSAKDASICTKLTSGNSITGCIVDENILQYKQSGNVKTYTLSNSISSSDTDSSTDEKENGNTNDTENTVPDTPTEETPEEEVAPLQYTFSLSDTSFTYTGSAVKPTVTISDGSRLLGEGTDYSITYKNNINAGTATIIITGKNGHSINETLNFSIERCDLSDSSITATALYSTKAITKPVPVITRNGKKLSNGKDFTLNYSNNGIYSTPGTYEITAAGIGNYTGTLNVTLSIIDLATTKLISKAKVSNVKNFTYGEVYTQDPIVSFGKEFLVKGKDYLISYPENPQAGTAVLTIIGIGEYGGIKQVKYKIIGTNIKKATVSGLTTTAAYTGSAITMNNCTLRLADGTILKENTDYTVSYSKNISAGKASIIFTGINGYTGTLKKTFTIQKCSLSNEAITANIIEGTTKTYVAGGVKPKVKVTFGNIPLRENIDYKLSYKNNKKCGTATVTITGKGNFSGKLDKNFTIVN